MKPVLACERPFAIGCVMNADATKQTSTERLVTLFETKLHLLQEMQALSLEQSSLVEKHEMTSLMTLLSRKQQLMESLQRVQLEMAPYRDEDPESRVWESPDRRQACRALVAECDKLTQWLIVQENQSIAQMDAQRDGMQSQIQQNAAASQVQRAYLANSVSELEASGDFTLEG